MGKNKILSAILSLMLLASLTIPQGFVYGTDVTPEEPSVQANQAEEVVDNSDISWYDPSGTTFDISSEGQLRGLAKLVNQGVNFSGKTISLMNDINLTEKWIPIGNKDNPFSGTFNGGGKQITGFIIDSGEGGYKGLFGNSNGTVKNFKISGKIGSSDSFITTGTDYIAGGVALNQGTVTGITSNVNIYVKNVSIYAIGGVVGENHKGGTVTKSMNLGYIEASKGAGGIAGRNLGTISDCVNHGEIKGNNGSKDSLGGITGVSGDKNGTTNTAIINCYNTGKTSNYNGRWYGGIAGMADVAVTVKNCYNIGPLEQGYSWNWNPIIGHVDSAYPTVTNNYSLEGLLAGDSNNDTKPMTIGTVTNEAKFKSSEMIDLLGGAYALDTDSINNGFPILLWQATSSSVTPDMTISKGGVYTVPNRFSGTITISTTESVVLVGPGTTEQISNLTVKYTIAGGNLTIEDLKVVAPVGTSPIIDFVGKGNSLSLRGANLLESNIYSNNAIIHVPSNGDAKITGPGLLYMYKRTGSAAIGGNMNETNGKIIINADIFAKGSQQGAVIGSGANAEGGEIIIEGGNINLMGNARGAIIGSGGGGGGGATAKAAGTTTVKGGTLTLTVDFTGAAIGAGGENNNNVANGGKLLIEGGSIKTVITNNSANNCSLWSGKVGVNDSAITAQKEIGGSAEVSLLTFDVNSLKKAEGAPAAEKYSILLEGTSIYDGGLHKYDYVSSTATINNWTLGTDSNLYLYLTKADHKLLVNDQTFNVLWDQDSGAFAYRWAGDKVVSLIDAIGTVDGGESSKTRIDEAQNAYDGLTSTDKKYVSNKAKLVTAKNQYEAAVVDGKIEAIGTVTLDKESLIQDARAAYNNLTSSQKTMVTKLNTLTEAEAKLVVLKGDKNAADNATSKIDGIGNVTLESKAAIDIARQTYDGLTDSQKGLVTNYSTLLAAETKYKELVDAAAKEAADKEAAAGVTNLINAIGSPVTLSMSQQVMDAKLAYDNLTEDQKAYISQEGKDKLDNSVSTIETLVQKPKMVSAAISLIPTKENLDGSYDQIQTIRKADNGYQELTQEEKAWLTQEEVDRLNQAKENTGLINHTSGNLKVEGLPWQVKVTANPIREGAEFDQMAGVIPGTTLVGMHGVTLTDTVLAEGVWTQAEYVTTAPLTVIITDNQFEKFNKAVGLHQHKTAKEDGTFDYDQLEGEITGNTVVFQTPGFSNVGVAVSNEASAPNEPPVGPTPTEPLPPAGPGAVTPTNKDNPKKTGDDSMAGVAAIVMIGAMATAAMVLRRKEN